MLGVTILFPTACVAYLVLSGSIPTKGRAYGKVIGKVRYKGELLAIGKIAFVGADRSRPAIGEIMHDGSYTVDTVPIGEVVVCLSSWVPIDNDKDPRLAESRVETLPIKYCGVDTSPLRFTVKKGMNHFDIELTD